MRTRKKDKSIFKVANELGLAILQRTAKTSGRPTFALAEYDPEWEHSQIYLANVPLWQAIPIVWKVRRTRRNHSLSQKSIERLVKYYSQTHPTIEYLCEEQRRRRLWVRRIRTFHDGDELLPLETLKKLIGLSEEGKDG